ncbi:hypothetical protein H5300_21210 [Vibrio sp. SG41-7]|uniref:hypothetical protein n=1 Tax=Vibrio sp. SG41-7 TaxID=2760973 RepID=UPI001603E8E5|nr:hypothetical protein [Vibrio sp. SG41-7]MBB1465793.1 hypothetical protein [Vibrio sp. SG41-7]
MAKSKKNPIVILRGKKCSVFPSDKEARPYYSGSKGVKGTKGCAIFYKCRTVEAGMRDLNLFQKWESIAPEFKVRNMTAPEAKVIIAAMDANPEQFMADQLALVEAERKTALEKEEEQRNQPSLVESLRASSKRAREREWEKIQEKNELNKKHVKFDCDLGSGGKSSQIKKVSGGVTQVEHEIGTKAPQKRLELGYAALKLADDALKQGADTVEILGLDVSVVNTLTAWASKWKLQDWKASSGKPLANIELVKPMVALYDAIKVKVSLGKREESESLPF